jgi:hypothetical protein
LQELEAIGVVEGLRSGAEDDQDDDRRPCTWALTGSDGEIIADVLHAQREAQKGVR